MALFSWSDEFSVNNKFIDNDHKHLIKLVNDFHDAIGQGKSHVTLGKALNNLIVDTEKHFKWEENVMQGMHYAEFLEHKSEHDRLTREVVELKQQLVAGETNFSIKLSMYLHDWLFKHILKEDRRLAQAITERPKRAYRRRCSDSCQTGQFSTLSMPE